MMSLYETNPDEFIHRLRHDVIANDDAADVIVALRSRVVELETQLAGTTQFCPRCEDYARRIEAARAMHVIDPDARYPHYCIECSDVSLIPWPCPTIRALAAVPPETP